MLVCPGHHVLAAGIAEVLISMEGPLEPYHYERLVSVDEDEAPEIIMAMERIAGDAIREIYSDSIRGVNISQNIGRNDVT